MKFLIQNSKGFTIYTNLHSKFHYAINDCNSESELFQCKFESCKKRHGLVKNDIGLVYLVSDQKNLIKSSKLFKKNLKIYSDLLKNIIKFRNELASEYADNVSRILHNVITLNGQNIQEIYSLVPQEELTKDVKKQLNVIKSHVLKKSDETSKTIFRLIKNNLLIKTEFQVFKSLNNPNQIVAKRIHSIRKVILNVFHAFFYDFKEKNVYVQIDECKEKLNVNYPTLTGALVHFIDNAAKYSMSKSTVFVNFNSTKESLTVSFEMMSFHITDEDFENIFEDGYSGYYSSQHNLNGQGMGMRMIKQLLNINNCEFKISRNFKPKKKISGLLAEFDVNKFDMIFKKK